MVKTAFDNDLYIQSQSAHIRSRIEQFGGKLYLEFGGKLYDDNHFHLVLQLQQHPQLAVGLEAGQNTGCVVVVVQLAAEFQIQLAAELLNAVADMGGLGLQILLIVKTNASHIGTSLKKYYPFIVNDSSQNSKGFSVQK